MPPPASAGEILLYSGQIPWSAAQRLRLHLVSGFQLGFVL